MLNGCEIPRSSANPEAGAEALLRVRDAIAGMRVDMATTVLTIALGELSGNVPLDRSEEFGAAVLKLLTRSLIMAATTLRPEPAAE
jgi:hypothetical protein